MHVLEENAADLFRQARSTTFRTWDLPSIISDLAPRWMVHNGLVRLECSDLTYISTSAEDAEQQFTSLMARFGNLPFFCISDTCDDADSADHRLLRIGQALETFLSLPSSFELPTTPNHVTGPVIEKAAAPSRCF